MIKFPTPKYEILTPWVRARHKCLYGGRGGGKSWSAAIAAIAAADECKCRILCTREVQISIQDSMYKLIKTIIEENGLDKNFRVLEKGITGLRHNSEFIFKGMQDIKSLEGIDIAIIEEAQQVSRENAERLIPTIRRPRSQMWWLWNPENEGDWVHQYFIENTPPNTIVAKVNYIDNPHCPQVLIDEANYLRDLDYEQYRHVWLGELKPANKGYRFINSAWLDTAASGDIKPLSQILMSRYALGSDIALQGEDLWATAFGKGNKLLSLDTVERCDGDTIAANLNSRILAVGRHNCDVGVDGQGAGAVVCDIMEKRYGLGDCLNRCSHKDRDFIPPPPKGTVCPTLDFFTNWKSQAWFQAKHDLEVGNIDLSEFAKKQPEDFKLLKQELIAHDMVVTNGKMVITPKKQVKKELGRSPDRADAFVIWNWVRRRVDEFTHVYRPPTYDSEVGHLFV